MASGDLRRVLLSIVLVGCTPDAPLAMPPVSAAFGSSVDGVPIRCDAETTRSVGSSATVEVALGASATLRVWLDGAPIEGRFAGERLRRAELALAPGVHALRIEVGGGDETRSCAVDLAYRPGVEAAADSLGAASETPLRSTRSDETGAIAEAVLSVPTTGSTARERADDFVARHGDAFGADPGTLQFAGERVLAGGWSVIEYHQWLGEARVFRAGLGVHLDPEGRARLVHARLAPGDASVDRHGRDVGAVLTLAQGLELGTVLGAVRVQYDVRRPAPGWWVEGVAASVLLDDATQEVLERRSNVLAEARVELVRAEPADWGLAELSASGGLFGPSVALEGPAGGLPIPAAGAMPSASDEELWLRLSDATAYAETSFGVEGFADWANESSAMGWAARAPSTSRVVAKDTELQNAFYGVHWDAIFFGSDLRNPDVVCHELGHALHLHRASFAEVPSTFLEALADAFMIGCVGALDETRDRYSVEGDESVGAVELRDIADLENSFGDVWADYDAFLATGREETALRDAYSVTFLLTHAIYQMHERHSIAFRTVAAMVWEAMTWTDVTTYAQLRDRWMATAAAWAESGREEYGPEIVCGMAQAFRVTKLDGEYGVGASCGESVEGVDFVCTAIHCPLCADVGEASNDVCPPETLEAGAPTCETADGRPTCVGSLAISGEGCADGEGRHCWCVEAEGGGAEWDCGLAGLCRTLPALARAYCPESAPAAEAMPDSM